MNVSHVRVGDVLRLERRAVTVNPLETYQEIGVRSFGKGIFHKEPVGGAEIGTKRIFRIEPGDLVFSNVFAWEGAVALATDAEQGFVGSHRFMTYVALDAAAVDARYLRYYFTSEMGIELLRKASPGSAGRNRTLAIDRFESIELPLPDIKEQRRVTEWLGQILDRYTQLRDAMESARSTGDATVPAWLQQAMIGCAARFYPLGEFGEVRRGRGPRYADGSGWLTLNQACVRAGTVDLSACREVEADWWRDVPPEGRVRSGDVLVNSTGEGTIGRSALAPDDAVGMPFDSHILAINLDESRLLPAFCDAFLRSPMGQTAIEVVKGANTTKQTELGKQKLEALVVPVPPISSQEHIVQELEKLESSVARLRASTAHRKLLVDALPIAAMRHAFSGLTS